MSDQKQTIAFIGLGVMAREMAINLLKAGFPVVVFDTRVKAVEDLLSHGAIGASGVAQAAERAAIAITMLPNTPEVSEVILGPNGLLAHPPSGKLIIDMSTISPEATRDMSKALADAGIQLLDAPVSGGPAGATNAKLSIMVGGDNDAFARAQPVFAAMGTTIVHVGASGAGQTVKLCNQLIVGINLQAISEALALARASGLDLDKLREVLLGGAASSWMLQNLAPLMIARDTRAGFRIDLMFKDLRLVNELAYALNTPLPATALVTSQYLEARAHGEGSNGNQALFRVYDRMTNTGS